MTISLSLILFLLVSCLLFSSVLSDGGRKANLRIQLLVPEEKNPTYWDGGVLPAMLMAVDDVNNATNILSNYTLKAEVSDTRCDPSEGTWQLIKAILDTNGPGKTKIISFIGASCSIVSEPTAALTGRLYKVPQVSYGSYSPVLSDRSMYPLFLRTAPSDLLFNEPRYALMNTYSWCYVATLHQTANLFSLAVQDFHERFKPTLVNSPSGACAHSDDNPVLFSFTGDPQIPLMQIKAKKIRIIYGFFYEDKALLVMCYALRLGLATDNHIWIMPAWFSEGWWDRAEDIDWKQYNCSCTSDDIIEAVKYSLLVDAFSFLRNESIVSDSGYTNSSYFAEYIKRRDDYFNFTSNTPSVDIPSPSSSTAVYDAIWGIGLALNATETELQATGHNLTEFQYSDSYYSFPYTTLSSNISSMIASNMGKLDFIGVSGRVTFDDNGTRVTITQISQYVPWTVMVGNVQKKSLRMVQLAVYNRTETGLGINYTIQPRWRLGYPPTDRPRPLSKLITPVIIYIMDTVLVIGIIIATSFLVFHIITIRKPLMANSAPYINIMITIGCIVMMGSSILLGIDSGTPQVTNGTRDNILDDIDKSAKSRYAIICMARVWLFTIGFTLSFGSLFAKTWQVYRVYTKADLAQKPFKMWNFFIIMAIQLFIDVLFLSIWTGVFPFRHDIYSKDDEVKNVITKHELCKCDNFSYLIGSLYVYKGLLVVFGLFLAYESRNVKYIHINDSRFVSVAMYIVVILIAISAPLSLVLAEQNFIIDPAYAIAVLLIVLTCMSCLMILYVPKFYYMAKGVHTMLPASKNEAFTPVDNLQLGHTDVNPEDVQSAEQEIKQLKEQVKQREIQLLSLARRASDQDSGVLCVSTEDTGGDGSNRGSESPTTTPPLHDTVTTESGGGDENEGGGGGGGKNKGENDEGKGGIGDEERAGGEEKTGAPPAQRKKTVKIADAQEIEL